MDNGLETFEKVIWVFHGASWQFLEFWGKLQLQILDKLCLLTFSSAFAFLLAGPLLFLFFVSFLFLFSFFFGLGLFMLES